MVDFSKTIEAIESDAASGLFSPNDRSLAERTLVPSHILPGMARKFWAGHDSYAEYPKQQYNPDAHIMSSTTLPDPRYVADSNYAPDVRGANEANIRRDVDMNWYPGKLYTEDPTNSPSWLGWTTPDLRNLRPGSSVRIPGETHEILDSPQLTPISGGPSAWWDAAKDLTRWGQSHYDTVNPKVGMGVRAWDPVTMGATRTAVKALANPAWQSLRQALGLTLTPEQKLQADLVDQSYQPGKAADFNKGIDAVNYEGVGMDINFDDPGGGGLVYSGGQWVPDTQTTGDISPQYWRGIADAVTESYAPTFTAPDVQSKAADYGARVTAYRAGQATQEAKAMANRAETQRQVEAAAQAQLQAESVQRSLRAAAARATAGPEGQRSYESVAAPKAPSAKGIRSRAKEIQRENKAIASAAQKRGVTSEQLRRTHEYVDPDPGMGRTKRVQKKAPARKRLTEREKAFIRQGTFASGGGGER